MLAPVTMNKAEKYAVSPDCAGDTGLRSFFMQNMGCSRKVYNLYVDFLYDTLEKASYKAGSLLPDVRLPEVTSFKKDYPFLKEADSLGLSNAKIDFQNAVDRFNEQKDHSSYTKRAKRRAESGTEPLTFRGLCGMPKFHSKARGYFSYTTNCQYPGEGKQLKQPTIRLSGNRLHLPKWEKDIILTVHRPLPQNAVIRNVTVSMDTDGRFYVSICYSYTLMMEMSVREAVLSNDASIIDRLRFIGLDYSNPNFYVDSEGRTANCPKAYRKAETRLAKLQRSLSHMQKDSNNYKKTLKKIQRLHTKISYQRKDYVCKEACYLSSTYDVVVVEDIDLRSMSQSLRLAKGLYDNGFGMFRDILARKLEEKGSVLVKIDKWYASTKTCSICGHKEPSVVLGVDEWTCPVCRAHHYRDQNAAVNIRDEGKRIFLEFFRKWLKQDAASRKKAEVLSAGRKKKKAA